MDELLERYRIAKAAADPDPWRERHDPVHPRQFAELDGIPMTGHRRPTWTRVGRIDDIPLLEGRSTSVDGRRIAIFRLLDGFAAIDAHCPHAAGPLADGIVADSCVTCPLHGRRFDLATGEALNGPETRRRPRGPRARTARSGCGLPDARRRCPYCGVGCGLDRRGATTAGSTAVRGDTRAPGQPRRDLPQADAAARGRARARPRDDADVARERWTSAGGPAAGARAIGSIARKLQRRHEPDEIAFYISGQLLTEDYYAVNKLAKGFLGTNNVDSNSRLCMSSAVAGYTGALGSDGPPPSYADIDEADVHAARRLQRHGLPPDRLEPDPQPRARS